MRYFSRTVVTAAAVAMAACASDATAPEARDDVATPPTETEAPAALTDGGVFAQAIATGEWVWYRLSADTLSPASDSPHAARLRTRYNPTAAASLDADGKVAEATVFSNGSLIVKEVYGDDGALAFVAVMIKAAGDPNAGHGDWLWAEYDANGNVTQSIAAPEETCHSCHFSGVDHTRMNDAHP